MYPLRGFCLSHQASPADAAPGCPEQSDCCPGTGDLKGIYGMERLAYRLAIAEDEEIARQALRPRLQKKRLPR